MKVAVFAGLALGVFGSAFGADLFLAGDSTLESCVVDGVKREPYRSWGESLCPQLKEGNRIRNFARSGHSTRMFVENGVWQHLLAEVKSGDYVLVQFGHNDQKHTTAEQCRTQFASPEGLYREYLLRFVKETREKGATPLLCTPIVRATFDESGKKLVDTVWALDGITLGSYAKIVRNIGAETGVDVVDMNRLTGELCEKVGREESYKFFVISTGLVRGKDGEPSKDVTHPIQRGADAFADLFVKDVLSRKLSIAGLFLNN